MSKNTGDNRRRFIGIDEFPGVPLEYAEALKSRGVTHTLHFLEASRSVEDRRQLAAATGIPVSRLEELRALCELTGIPCIGPALARLFYYAGIRSAEALAGTNEEELGERLNRAGKANPAAAASMKKNELHRCVQQAKAICESDREREQHQ